MRDDEGDPALLGTESGALTTMHAPRITAFVETSPGAEESNGGGACIVMRELHMD
jgi:hypothetical protein